MPATALGTWAIAVLATAGVIIRPWRLPEAIWAVLGAVALVAFGLLPWRAALAGVGKGLDVYLFLAGMMLLAELARQEGLFDWLASFAVEHAGGSPQRLFVLVYAVGTVVTVFLSNDATAVVLTPAVYAATRAAGATPLPYLFACAFIANAASFALPISNPANLVVFAGRMPHLWAWLAQFALPTVAAVVATYLMLRLTQNRALRGQVIARAVARPKLMRGGRHAAYGIAATAVALTACSAFDLQLGLPTFICGGATAAIILAVSRGAPILQRAWTLLRHIAWGVLPLVAGLFVLVEALAQTGVIAALARLLASGVAASVTAAAWTSGVVIAVACNLMNNLPVGLIAGSVVGSEHVPPTVTGAALIGVDLGPNLSVTGSLATILWLASLRRERVEVGALRFLMVGLAVTPPALVLALAALMAIGAR
ncbi:MAG TPA: arsenic transporter [Xanthobacteraceae bacterium]|nr:arsenic transporter [Xanthobacteraceae bacterium]